MKIINFSEEYLKKTAKLCRQNLVYDVMPDHLLREKTFGDPDYREDLTLLAVDDDEKEVAGFIQGVIRNRKDGRYGYVKLLCVSKDNRRNNIAQQLYDILEDKFRDEEVKVIRVGESYPNYLMPGVDPYYTEAICFFERNSFEKFNDTANLVVELTQQEFDTKDAENHLHIENIFVKRAEQKDKEKVLDWLQNAFEGWIPEVTEAFNCDPIPLFISGKAGSVWAFSAYEVNNKGTGWFGPMGTDIATRGKGIGAVLLKRCLKAMKEEGFTKAIIPWVGPIPFYMHYANAKVNRIFWRYEKKLP